MKKVAAFAILTVCSSIASARSAEDYNRLGGECLMMRDYAEAAMTLRQRTYDLPRNDVFTLLKINERSWKVYSNFEYLQAAFNIVTVAALDSPVYRIPKLQHQATHEFAQQVFDECTEVFESDEF